MSTLIEIESAVSALPPMQQQKLLAWLRSVVEAKTAETSPSQARRELWLQKLEVRRQRGAMDRRGTPITQMMDDLRGD